MVFEHIKVRIFDEKIDKSRVQDLERRCEVGTAEHAFIYTDTKGDPICRIRNSPLYIMLVAELNNEIVGLIQGTIKVVKLHHKTSKVGYVLGLRISPIHRRKGIGSRLVHHIEQWFISNDVYISYMATEKDNKASVKLFVNKLGYVKFKTPSILIHPTNNLRLNQASSNIEIVKLSVEQAEFLYRNFMGSTEYFPHDIDKILRNKLSLGTWVAYYQNGSTTRKFPFSEDMYSEKNGKAIPKNWAMVSVWDSGGVFKLKLGKAPLSCLLYAKSSYLLDRVLPCCNVPTFPDFLDPFGFYFMYGIYQEGPFSGKLVKKLCKFVHNFGGENGQDCKIVVTEIGGCDKAKPYIPHWNLLSCPEDLWCIKALRNEEEKIVHELTNNSSTKAIFVDPREV